MNKYFGLLEGEGVPENCGRVAGAAGGDPNQYPLDLELGEPKEAFVYCERYLPLSPPEFDVKYNPNYPAQWEELLKCMRKGGIPVVSIGEAGSYNYEPHANVDDATEKKVYKDCETKIFAGKK